MKRIYRAAALILICAAMCAALAGCGNAEEKELIGRAAAREIALKDAGFPARWVIQLDADLEHDDGQHNYDVFFINATTKYYYTIDGDTGAIVSSSTAPLFDEEK